MTVTDKIIILDPGHSKLKSEIEHQGIKFVCYWMVKLTNSLVS